LSRHAAERLPAAERRQALVDAAMRVFSTGSYAGATTADIAREAGVSEPILYRHFASKRELYIACLDEVWRRTREQFDANLARLGDRESVKALGMTLFGMQRARVLPTNLWIQALTEAGEDAEIRRYLRRHVKELHDFIADAIRRGQEAGGVEDDRDPDAEAWVFVAGGLLLSVADRLGGVLDHETFLAIARARHRWLTGREPRFEG
jgi:AcrR family transcriptional regulator